MTEIWGKMGGSGWKVRVVRLSLIEKVTEQRPDGAEGGNHAGT